MQRLTLECGHYQIRRLEDDLAPGTMVYVGDPAPRDCIYCRPSMRPPIVDVQHIATVLTRSYWEQLRQTAGSLIRRDQLPPELDDSST